MQLDLFAAATDAPARPHRAPGSTPAHVQGALFRPDFRAMRAPRAEAVQLDPALHDGALL